MKSEVKQLVWEHIWAGEYKQAIAILGDFKGDTEAEELIIKVEEMIYEETQIYADDGLYRDKNKDHPKKPDRQREVWWKRIFINPVADLMSMITFVVQSLFGAIAFWWIFIVLIFLYAGLIFITTKPLS
jgi:hypothetical protein